ncbi:MAG: hypothetical protein GF381_02435 [Candidatus Pacebacteria bacterium]|nr:hypothetical protein [Candidatus Paceibacterota bacterium]
MKLNKTGLNKLSLSKSRLSLIVVILLSALFSWWLMSSTFGYQDGQFLVDSKLWSDFGAHLPLIRSFSLGNNFPPEYPQFAHEPIRYHYLFYMLVGGLERLGLNLALSLNLVSAFGLTGLLVMIYQLANLVSRRKSAGWLAWVLFLLNGSLVYLFYFNESGFGWSSLVGVSQLKHFVQFGPWNGDPISAFWNWNILTNQRHLAFSFSLILFLVWPLLKTSFSKDKQFLLNRRWLLFIWFGLILLPFFHQASYVLTVGLIGGWLVLNPRLIKQFGWVYGLGLLYSLPGWWYFFQLGGSSLQFKLGFLAADRSLTGIFSYWLLNLGYYWLLLPVLFVIGDWPRRKLLLVFLSFFLLANLTQLSADMINNHKLVNFFQIGLVVLVADFLVQMWQAGWLIKLVVIVWIPFLTFSGVVDAFPIVNDYGGAVSDIARSPASQWILAETKPDAVFILEDHFYHPALLAGRRSFVDYGYFAWSLGYDDDLRRQKIDQIFSAEIDQAQWCQLVKLSEVDYLALTRSSTKSSAYQTSWLVKTQQPVYQDQTSLIYSYRQICQEDQI